MDVRDAVFQTWSALFSSGQVAELRVLGINHTESFNAGGWFDNPAVFADVAARYDAKNPIGIYVTINPLYPACLARSGNAVVERTRTLTADRDVSSRQWLPIDIDPIRPSGVSSSNNEQAITLNSAYKIIAWLTTECQFPEPLLANSGNGTHILYRVRLDNTDDAKATIAGCLAALAARFDTPISQIDTTVSNAARIWRCYGTHARKGTNTDDRPHRQSSVISASRLFADFVPVPTPMLLQLASRVKKKRKQRANRRTVAADVDLDAFIAKHGIQVKRQQAWDGGTKHILEACIFDPSHTRTSACLGKNRAGVVFYKCQHSACDGRGWKDVRSHFEGAKTPAGVVTRRRDRDASDSGKPDPFELARAFIQEACTDHDSNQVIVRRWRCSIYLWDLKTHAYRILDDDTLRVMLLRFLEDAVEAVTTRLAADVRACFEALITLDTRAEIPFEATIDPGTMQTTTRHARHNWHILSNGIVDIDEITGDTPLADCLMPHAPTWFSTTALPFSFPTRPSFPVRVGSTSLRKSSRTILTVST